MAQIQKVIGLMSGTSLDGVDAAVLETDGETVARPGPVLTLAYDSKTRAQLRSALEAARGVAAHFGNGGASVPHGIREAERHLTEVHALAVRALLDKARLAPGDIALIGFHGQTILHRPELRLTWQIGDGALLARLAGIDVINDFRSADVNAGGQGAPLVPLYHAVLVRNLSAGLGGKASIAAVNIGGVANVTYVSENHILAFDTGPGNAPIDDWMARHTGAPLDAGGALARSGLVDAAVLGAMLAHPFFDRLPPKSLDRLDFGLEPVEGLSPEDGAATLAAFTAASIARAGEHFPDPVAAWIVCGGGRHNAFLMDQLKGRVNAPVLKAEDAGWNGDALEAEAFAYLAKRAQKGLPLSLPTTTGVSTPMTGGKLHRKP